MGLSCFKSWKHDSTGRKGNRDVLASPGSYFFLSNSAGQGDEWLKSLNKGVWIPFTGVFGQRLEETVLYERRYGVRLVPLVVEQCVTFIRERGLHEVGLFRQPGQASLVKELQEAFDAGERPSFDSSTDIHTVASLLKLYLRQLPEPLVPYSHYQDFLFCGQKLSSDRMLGLTELRDLLHELPVANFNLLNFICQFLNEVQRYSSGNKMSCQNLATVFGPNILRAKAEDPQSIMGGAALVQLLMLELIKEHESLFSRVRPSISAHPHGGLHASPSALRQSHLQPSPCLRQMSLPLITERSQDPDLIAAEGCNLASCVSSVAAKSESSQKRLLGHRYTSSHPENCFYPLPTTSQPLRHHSDRHNVDYLQHHAGHGSSAYGQTSATSQQDPWSESRPVLTGWGKAWPGLGEAGGSHLWSSGGAVAAEEQGAVPDAASGGSSEAQEDSTPSAYDNLDRESLCERMEDVTGGHFETNVAGSHTEPGDELKKVWQTVDSSSSWSSCEDDDEIIPHATSPASCSLLSTSPLSTGSSEVFLPSGPPDLQGAEPQSQPQDAHSLLAELQKQMAQQRAEYQARIHRLERCNDVLERQVAVLRVSLEQQKRSQSVAEIKIRNMERAKVNADRRNTTLQREMELFFQMYGEIRKREGGGGKRDRILQSL
ncbi:rho GTPase-activating protein 22 [Aulostomus maculatus]